MKNYLFDRTCSHMRCLCVMLLLAVAVNCRAVAVLPSDSIERCREFKPQELVAPVAMVTVGAFGVKNGWLRHANREVIGCIGSHRQLAVTDYLQFADMWANLALGSLGVESKHCFYERLSITATSWVILEIAVQGLKRIVGSERPDGSDCNSFPSGHAARAFMGAELVRAEYGAWWGGGAYMLASGVAYMRVCGRHHWPTDVIAGAGIGILAAKAGSWLLPIERRLFGVHHRASVEIVALPSYNPTMRTPQMSVALVF